MQVSFKCHLFSLDKYLEVELLGQFFEKLKLLSVVAAPTYMPANVMQSCPFLHILGSAHYFLGFLNVFIYLAALGVSCGMWDLVC